MRNKETYNKWLEKVYHEKYLPAFLAFIALYPFGLEDLPGEIWKWITNYEELYQISNFGRVKSFNGLWVEAKILKPVLHKNGYLYCSLRKNGKLKIYSIHRLVAKAFITNPKNLPEINHIDGNKLNNHFENLEWCTSKKNIEHSIENDLRKFGEERTDTKLTNEKVREIRRIYIEGDTQFGAPALGLKYGVSTSTIYNVIHRRSYKNVD